MRIETTITVAPIHPRPKRTASNGEFAMVQDQARRAAGGLAAETQMHTQADRAGQKETRKMTLHRKTTHIGLLALSWLMIATGCQPQVTIRNSRPDPYEVVVRPDKVEVRLGSSDGSPAEVAVPGTTDDGVSDPDGRESTRPGEDRPTEGRKATSQTPRPAGLDKDVEGLRKRHGELLADLRRIQQEITRGRAQQEQHKAREAQLQAELEQRSAKLVRLDEQLRRGQERQAQLRRAEREMVKRVEEREARLQEVTASLGKTNQELAAATSAGKADQEKLLQELTVIRQRIKGAQAAETRLAARKGQLRQQSAALSDEVQRRQQQLAAARDQTRQAEDKLAVVNGQIARARRQSDALTAKPSASVPAAVPGVVAGLLPNKSGPKAVPFEARGDGYADTGRGAKGGGLARPLTVTLALLPVLAVAVAGVGLWYRRRLYTVDIAAIGENGAEVHNLTVDPRSEHIVFLGGRPRVASFESNAGDSAPTIRISRIGRPSLADADTDAELQVNGERAVASPLNLN
ncbi:hypothetical protein LCGC14_2299870, partial [marine sediment metagenome]